MKPSVTFIERGLLHHYDGHCCDGRCHCDDLGSATMMVATVISLTTVDFRFLPLLILGEKCGVG